MSITPITAPEYPVSPLVRFDTQDGSIVVDLFAVAALERNDKDGTFGVLLRSGEGFRVNGMPQARIVELFDCLTTRLGVLSDCTVDVL